MSGKIAAIGTFDGVHTGHRAVLDKMKEIAAEKGLQPVAVTFDRHPLELIAPHKAPKTIMSATAKLNELRRNSVTPVMVSFDESTRNMTAAEWLKKLRDEMDVTEVVVGYDNTFGKDGVNLSLSDYKKIAEDLGMNITEAPYVKGVSSSAIRKLIESGDVEKATDLLGRPFTLSGIVTGGNKLGRSIGFPTANLKTPGGLLVPGNGVYAATAVLPDGKEYPAMVNIGVRPTIKRGDARTVEAHILGDVGDLYDKKLKLIFKKRLRDEIAFDSIDRLKAQLQKDRQATLEAFATTQQK